MQLERFGGSRDGGELILKVVAGGNGRSAISASKHTEGKGGGVNNSGIKVISWYDNTRVVMMMVMIKNTPPSPLTFTNNTACIRTPKLTWPLSRSQEK
jgi:hypothetical protein